MFSTAGKGQPCAYTELSTWRCSRSLLPPRERTPGWNSITHGFAGGRSLICSNLSRHRTGAPCLERAQTNAGFSQNSSKMLSRTKSTIVAAKSPFTLAPTSVWVSLAALGPAQPQRLLIPPQPPPSRVCCPHQPVPTSVRQIPAFWDGKGLPDRADVVTKQSNAQCLLLANSPMSPFPCRSEGIGLYHTKDTGARAAPPKTNSLHKKMKESKSKRG